MALWRPLLGGSVLAAYRHRWKPAGASRGHGEPMGGAVRFDQVHLRVCWCVIWCGEVSGPVM